MQRPLPDLGDWPVLEWEQWRDTAETLHMYMQIVGKARLALTPIQNHWWNIAFYLTARGLTTSAMHNHDDYPDIIPEGQSVDTIADGAILIAYNWAKGTDHYQRVERFIIALFPRIAEFQKPPHHVKWREVNLSSNLDGWSRFEPAETWLNNNRAEMSAIDQKRSQFNAFLESRGLSDPAPNQNDRLFEEFLRWSRAREPHPSSN
jgi:hypothetical protein